LRADGKGRLTLQVTTVAAAPIQYTVISEMIRQHWQKIGIDLQVQENERSLASKRNDANECQMYTWLNDSSDEPIAEPTYNFPNTPGSQSGPLYGRWFASGGKQGKEPPASIKKVGEMWRKAMGVPEAEAIALVKDMWKVLLDEVWYIGVVGQSGAMQGIQVTKTKLGNVPRRWLHLNRQFSPAVTRPMCFYWKG
jgi:peptide/nickel transport system substrate-binding protein